MRRLRLLDPFCCEGAASQGYRRAGFEVYGIDLFKHDKLDANGNPVLDKRGKPIKVGFSQDRYPFQSVQMDAIEALQRLVDGQAIRFPRIGHIKGRLMEPFNYEAASKGLTIADFDAIHASPPCQHASAGTRAMRARGESNHPALIEPTRELLEQTGLPWVIENVSGAALRDPMMLCGSMFDITTKDEDGFPLRLERHRLFESNIALQVPGPCQHDPNVWAAGVYGGGRARKPGQTAAEHRHASRYIRKGGYVPASKAVQQRLIGGDWMTKGGMAQALPPVYTEWIGAQLIDHINQERAA